MEQHFVRILMFLAQNTVSEQMESNLEIDDIAPSDMSYWFV